MKKRYNIVVAMVTVLRTKIKYVHHREERFFFLKLCIFVCNNLISRNYVV